MQNSSFLMSIFISIYSTALNEQNKKEKNVAINVCLNIIKCFFEFILGPYLTLSRSFLSFDMKK